jgi:hypothetical protein
MYFTIRRCYHGWCILHEITRHPVPHPTSFPFVTSYIFLHNGSLLTIISTDNMAPRLSTSKLIVIRDMIESESFTTSEMADLEESSDTKADYR